MCRSILIVSLASQPDAVLRRSFFCLALFTFFLSDLRIMDQTLACIDTACPLNNPPLRNVVRRTWGHTYVTQPFHLDCIPDATEFPLQLPKTSRNHEKHAEPSTFLSNASEPCRNNEISPHLWSIIIVYHTYGRARIQAFLDHSVRHITAFWTSASPCTSLNSFFSSYHLTCILHWFTGVF